MWQVFCTRELGPMITYWQIFQLEGWQPWNFHPLFLGLAHGHAELVSFPDPKHSTKVTHEAVQLHTIICSISHICLCRIKKPHIHLNSVKDMQGVKTQLLPHILWNWGSHCINRARLRILFLIVQWLQLGMGQTPRSVSAEVFCFFFFRGDRC